MRSRFLLFLLCVPTNRMSSRSQLSMKKVAEQIVASSASRYAMWVDLTNLLSVLTDELIGAIGATCPPIQTLFPLPLYLLWSYIVNIASRTGHTQIVLEASGEEL